MRRLVLVYIYFAFLLSDSWHLLMISYHDGMVVSGLIRKIAGRLEDMADRAGGHGPSADHRSKWARSGIPRAFHGGLSC